MNKNKTPGEYMELFFTELKYERMFNNMSKILGDCGAKASEAGAAFKKLALIGSNVGYVIDDEYNEAVKNIKSEHILIKELTLPFNLIDEYEPIIPKKIHPRKYHQKKKNSLYKQKWRK